MSKKLAMNTTLGDVTYKAGTVPPADVAKKITNPKAWAVPAKAADGESDEASVEVEETEQPETEQPETEPDEASEQPVQNKSRRG